MDIPTTLSYEDYSTKLNNSYSTDLDSSLLSSTDLNNVTYLTSDNDIAINASVSTESSTIETDISIISSGYSALEIVFTTIGFGGIIGNLSSICVILSSKKLRKKLTNHFLINQCVIDILAGFFLVTNTLTKINNLPERFGGISGTFLCRFWYSRFFLWLTLMASSYSLVIVSIERYLEIVHPILHKVHFSHAKAYCMMGAAYAVVIVLHIAMSQAIDGVIDGQCYLFTSWPSQAVQVVYGCFSALINYILPVSVHLFCYICILIAVRQKRNLPQTTNNQNIMHKVQRNIFKVLLTVVVAYIVCFSWNTFLFLFFNLGVVSIDFSGWSYNLSVIMVYINCCINPIIYVVQYREYRSALVALACICQNNKVGPLDADTGSMATTKHNRGTVSQSVAAHH